MKRLESHKRLIVRQKLSTLADHLRGEVELIAELEAKFPPRENPPEIPETDAGEERLAGFPAPSACARECLYPVDARVWRAFREAGEALRRHDLPTQADEILSLYGNTSGNAARTLQYVESLLVDLEPERVRSEGETKGDDTLIGSDTDAAGLARCKRQPKATVNARMLEMLQAEPEVRGLTAEKWAKRLGCVKSTVAVTPTWNKLKMFRDELKARKAMEGARRRRTKRGD